MANNGIKVSELAKDLKLVAKDVQTVLVNLGCTVKSTTSTVTEEEAAYVFDAFLTEQSDIEDVIAEHTAAQERLKEEEARLAKEKAEEEARKREEAIKAEAAAKADALVKAAQDKLKAEKAAQDKATAQKTADAKSQSAEADKKAREKAKAENEAREKARKEAALRAKAERQAAGENKADKKRPKKGPAKKQGGQRIEFVGAETAESDEYKVQTDERRRYVDTRTSTVDMDKLEKSDHIEDLANDVRISGNNKKQKNKRRKDKEIVKPKKVIPVKVITEVEVGEAITVGDFAAKIGKTSAEIVKRLMMLGIMATTNQAIDYDTAALIGQDFGITVNQEVVVTKEERLFEEFEKEDAAEDLITRPPVVVVMGHVDHGKTSLLDAIRDTSVTSTEAGGITQHIGAYTVNINDRDITFLDTPGHEAFTTMRARGAQVTDVAIIVVAADDGIMPQTIEAINHAKAAGVTIIVAINKIDKEGANPDLVRQMLTEYDLVPEEWGGDTICVEVSAKQHKNIDELLENVLLVADVQELKANPNREASGTVIEARVDKGRGPIATVLVQNGTLNVGDIVICGTAVGHVRAMVNDKGRRIKVAGPSIPVEIQGLDEAPNGGDKFVVVANEKLAREVAEQRKQEEKETVFNKVVKVNLDNLFSQIDEGNMKELNVIIKADVQGSVEAVKQSLEKLSNDEVRVKAIHGGVGGINESDIMLANASNAIIVGFNVRPDSGALSSAERLEVDIRLYSVIYQAIEEIEAAMKGMLEPEFKEVVVGHAEIRQTFKVSGVGTIAGCYVTSGKIVRNAGVRVVRNNIVVFEGELASLKRFKDDVKEVAENFECGLSITNYNDIKEGDTIECYVMEEIAR